MAERKLVVEIIGDSRSLERSLDRSTKKTKEFDRTVSSTFRGVITGTGAFQSLGRSVAFASGAFLGGAGLTAAVKSSIGAASNLAEQTNKVNVIFGESARTITDWGKTTATSIGIANDEALTAAGTFGNLFSTVGLLPAKNAELSRSLVVLAADLASFNNASPEEALDALRSGLIGEAEPLRRFGILLSETRVQQEAMRETGIKTASNLTAQQKLLARYALILKDSKIAQGDFARTQDGLANSSRQLKAELRDTAASIGTALLPFVSKATLALRDFFGDADNQRKIQRTLNETIVTTGEVMKDLEPVAKALADTIVGTAKAVDILNSAFDRIPGHSQSLIDLFNKIPGHDKSLLDLLGVGGGAPQIAPSTRAGQSTADRVAGRAPGGAGAFQKILAGGAAAGGSGGRLSLVARFTKAELQLAIAQRTRAQADDRKALEVEASLLRDMIASHKKQFRDKKQLNQQLTQVIQQIQQIDDQAQQDRLDKAKKAADKQKAAQEKAAALAKKLADRARAARKKERDAAIAAAKAARDAAKEAARSFRDLISTERERIGALFGGPFFNPSEAQRKQALGAPNPQANARSLITDLKQQIAQFKAFDKDLQTLARKGAPPQLLAELRQGGLDVAPQVHALATASGGTFAQFKRLFIQREQLAVKAAKEIRPVVNLTVIVNKDTGHVSVKTTPHGQTRGRNPGVVVQGGRVRGD